jgi:hypothetical protein
MTAPAAGHGRDGRGLVRGVDYVPDSFDGSDDEDLGDEEVRSARVEGDEKVAELELGDSLAYGYVSDSFDESDDEDDLGELELGESLLSCMYRSLESFTSLIFFFHM